jgi:hypothetical protein
MKFMAQKNDNLHNYEVVEFIKKFAIFHTPSSENEQYSSNIYW